MNCHGENTLQPINKRNYFLNSCRISGNFDTKFTTMAQIEQIIQEFRDPKIDNILNLEQVYFLVTRVTWPMTQQALQCEEKGYCSMLRIDLWFAIIQLWQFWKWMCTTFNGDNFDYSLHWEKVYMLNCTQYSISRQTNAILRNTPSFPSSWSNLGQFLLLNSNRWRHKNQKFKISTPTT